MPLDASASPLPSRPPATILVVEDHDMLREVLERTLVRSGFVVLSASNGVEAIARFHAVAVDLVVTDMEMPQSDGFELIGALRRERPGVAIVAVSGAERVLRDPRAVEKLGIKALHVKPVSGADLVDAVRRALAPTT
jgi:two-component system cell cycle sensor histidine kinase/response regulator CckA